jgi:hypothetical protein
LNENSQFILIFSVITQPSKYDVKTFTNPGGFFSASMISTHSVTSNHSGSGNNSGPKFLFERKFLV